MIELEGRSLCSFCFEDIKPEMEQCSCCGRLQSEAEEKTDFLPVGTILFGEYLVGKILGNGGFGVTYLGYNLKEKKKVAIKEFFPEALCYRVKGEEEVRTRQGESEKKFREGAEKFYNEAKNIAMFSDNPNIINVYTFFNENNTSYFVMEYVDGIDLKNYVRERGGKIDVRECCSLLLPILDALSDMHEKQILHRDISPDNIYIARDGKIKLLDFGAARQRIDEDPKSLSVVLKPGFAPVEQYQRKGKQGGWTDVYAFAATIYYCVTGIIPDPVTDRIGEDKLKNPAVYGVLPGTTFGSIIMHAMAIQVADRISSAKELKILLEPYAKGEVIAEKRRNRTKTGKKSKKKIWMFAGGGVILTAGIVIAIVFSGSSLSDEEASLQMAGEIEKQINEQLPENTPTPTPTSTPTPTATPVPVYVEWEDARIAKAVADYLGEKPEEITEERLQDVHVLRFDSVQFEHFEEIRKLTGLNDLTVTNSEIKSLEPVSRLFSLHSLNLSKNKIKDLTGIEALIGLRSLNLEENQIQDLTPIGSLSNLEELNLGSNQIKNIEPLCGLAKLEKLYLMHNKVKKLPDMKNMTSLKVLNMTDNELNDISKVSSLTSIQKLYFLDNEISNIKSLKKLSTLTFLDLRKNMILDTDSMEELNKNVANYKGKASDQKVQEQTPVPVSTPTYGNTTNYDYSTPAPVWTPAPATPAPAPAPADEQILW